MKWFDKWFAKQAKKAWEAAQADSRSEWPHEKNSIYVSDTVSTGRHPANNRLDSNGINMKLHVANGGYIIEFQRWDNVKDRHFNELHVINDSENLGERLSEVIVQYIISNH
jgi:hypothetical protein